MGTGVDVVVAVRIEGGGGGGGTEAGRTGDATVEFHGALCEAPHKQYLFFCLPAPPRTSRVSTHPLVFHSPRQGCVLAGDAGESVSVDESGGCVVWRGAERAQVLPHPSGLWCVCALPNGDFATGCQVKCFSVF